MLVFGVEVVSCWKLMFGGFFVPFLDLHCRLNIGDRSWRSFLKLIQGAIWRWLQERWDGIRDSIVQILSALCKNQLGTETPQRVFLYLRWNGLGHSHVQISRVNWRCSFSPKDEDVQEKSSLRVLECWWGPTNCCDGCGRGLHMYVVGTVGSIYTNHSWVKHLPFEAPFRW